MRRCKRVLKRRQDKGKTKIQKPDKISNILRYKRR
jgi:hypothetical protein